MEDKRANMNNRQRVEALLNRQKPDRVPIWPFYPDAFAAVKAGYTIADGYNNPQKAYESQRDISKEYDWVFTPWFLYAAFGGWEFGGDIKWPSGDYTQSPSLIRCPVETEEDVLQLDVPDVKSSGFIPLLDEFNSLASKEMHENQPFNVQAGDICPFTIACNVCSPEKMLRWMLKKPDIAHRLMRLATDYTLELATYWKNRFGIEGVLVTGGEATATNQLISPKQFETFTLPYLKESYEHLASLGYKHIHTHICGEQNGNLPFWREVPLGDPGIISIGHEIDILTAGEYFPEHIILGNIEPAIIQTGTEKQVYDISVKCIEKGKQCPGGFVLAPGCQIGPMSPKENVMAMTKAVNEVGWY